MKVSLMLNLFGNKTISHFLHVSSKIKSQEGMVQRSLRPLGALKERGKG